MRSASPRRTNRLAALPRRLLRPGLATSLLVVCLVLAAAFVAIAVQSNAIAREIATTKVEIERLREELVASQGDAAYKLTDEYLLQRARDLGYIRPGESLIAVEHDAVPPVTERERSAVTGRLQRWLALFVH